MKKVEAELGVVSFIGAASCAVIAAELWEDLTARTEHFRLPRSIKVLALVGFCLFTLLETNKTRLRFARTLNIA